MNKTMLYMLILAILPSQVVYCQTDLSTNNCPEQFNITEANVTTGIGTSQLAVFFYSSFSSQTRQAQVQRIIVESDRDAYNTMVTSQYLWPFIAIAAIFLITYLTVILCIVFEKSCPPCHSWRRDFSKRPYEKFQIRCVALFAFIFGLAILITSIVAFTFIPSMHLELQKTKCSIYGALDVALNGDGLQWGGFSHIKNQVGNISELLPSANSQVNTYFDDDESIPDLMDEMKQFNLDIYSHNMDAQTLTPNPNTTSIAISSNAAIPTVDSYFILNYLGPNGTSDTMTNQIDTKLRNTQQLSDQADEIVNSAFILVQSSDTIASNTENSQQLLTMYENQLLSFKSDLDQFSQQYFDPIFNWGIYVVQVVVGFVLVASLAILIGTVSVHILDILECRHFIHFGWIIYGIMYFGIIFITFITLPMGSVGYSFCQYYNASLTNETEYAKISDYYAQNVLNKLDVCLFGDGNVLKKFQIQDEMNTVANLFTNIDLFNQYDNATNSKYVDQTLSQTIITDYLQILEDYRIGKTKDVDSALNTFDNAEVSLDGMKQFTLLTSSNENNAIPPCTRDRWVFHADDCLDTQFEYQTTDDQANGLNIDMTFDTCFSLNTQLSSGSSGIWSRTDMNKRYKQIKNDCQQTYTAVMQFAQAITNYRDSRIDLFQNLIDQVTDLQDLHNSFDSTLDSFRSNLSAFQSTQSIRNLNNYVTNQIDGLLVSSKCIPIGNRMKFVYNTFCVNAMGHAVSLGICAIVLLCLMIGGLFTGCVFAQRIATIKRLHTIHQDSIFALPEQSVHSQKFQRREKSSSDDSSSSEED